MNQSLKFAAILLVLVAWPAQGDSRAATAAADAEHFGAAEDQLFWDFEQKVAGFRNMDKIMPTRVIPAGDDPYPLPRDEVELGDVEFTFEERVWTVDEYMDEQKVAGLILVKDGFVVYEHYALGNTEESRWVSYSVAKSVTSLLVGAAIRDGYIDNVDEAVTTYLPRLRSSPYEQTSIRNLLHMASGVEWNEDYVDPESDLNRISWETLASYDYLLRKGRSARPGEVFNYNTVEANLVGNVVRSAVGNNLSTYLSEKIWKPFGMEYNAYWVLTEPGGGEFGGASINATLRDYARIGLFALHAGVLRDGTKTLPDDWMAESTTPFKGYAAYGYLWWLRGDGAYAASGIFGQQIYIDPQNNVVVAQHSARDNGSSERDTQFMSAAIAALVEATAN